MAQKKAASHRPNEEKEVTQTEPAPASELAAMVRGCKEQWGNVLILADWLEERLGLSGTASLLRSPDLQLLATELQDCEDFESFALGSDVFVWLAQGHYRTDPISYEGKPCMVFGLYAHPEGKPSNWARVVGMVALEEETDTNPQRPWDRLVKKHPRVEDARRELAAFTKRK